LIGVNLGYFFFCQAVMHRRCKARLLSGEAIVELGDPQPREFFDT